MCHSVHTEKVLFLIQNAILTWPRLYNFKAFACRRCYVSELLKGVLFRFKCVWETSGLAPQQTMLENIFVLSQNLKKIPKLYLYKQLSCIIF